MLQTLTDEELYGQCSSDSGDESGCLIFDGDIADDAELAREATLEQYQGLGRVILWAVLQRQPVPSVIATPLFIGQILGVDVIRGNSEHRLSEVDLCNEVLLINSSLLWLVDGLSEESVRRHEEENERHLRVSSCSPSTLHRPLSLALLSDGALDDTSAVTMENREEKLRSALGEILLDKRKEVMGAVRCGFMLQGALPQVSEGLLGFSPRETSLLVSGVEKVSGHDLVSRLDVCYLDEEDESSSEDGVAMGDESCSGLASLDPAVLKANVDMFSRVVQSERFSAHVSDLLRFITGCPSIIDQKMEINIEFDRKQTKMALPTSRTCFNALFLSAEAYDSDDHLAKLLEICAAHSTSFGRK